MEIYKGLMALSAENRSIWRSWLQDNHLGRQSVWLIIYRKTSGQASIYYEEAVEEALCFGWVDSKGNKRDPESYYLLFAKRNPKSKWSKINKNRVAKLLEQGQMYKVGIEVVEAAKQNGAWTALDDIDDLVIPADLKDALDSYSGSFEQFDAFPPSAKKGILEWIQNAKLPETRKKRIDETASLAQKGVRANQWKKG
jgi:uncharacterized protein YdeI (YjbR/CyaY-like superfamily)